MRALLLLALLMLAFWLPARADEYPVASGEQTARACYMHAMGFWNTTMARHPFDQMYLRASYEEFAKCATVAIVTGKHLPNGETYPWLVDYFADTVGSMDAQLQLAAATRGITHCNHIALARDLAEQALQTTQGLGSPSLSQFNDDWSTLLDAIRTHALACGMKGVSI